MPTLAAAPLTLRPPTEGVRRDVHPTEVPPAALVDAGNWIRWRGRFRTRLGLSAFGQDLAQRPLGLIQYTQFDGTNQLVLGTQTGWWRLDQGTSQWVNITGTPLTGSPVNHVVFRPFSKAGATWLLGVNGKDTPKKWNGAAATYTEVGGSPPVARCLMVLAERVLLGNLSSGATVSPVAVDVSAFLDFDAGWGAVQTTLLATTPGAIVAMQEMGYLQGVIYKEDAIELAIAQDAAVPFRFEFKQRVPGPVSSAAVAVIAEGLQAYLGFDGAVRVFDGVQARSLGTHIQRIIADTWSLDGRTRAWITWNPTESALLVVYPSQGTVEPNRAVWINWPGLDAYPLSWRTRAFSIGGSVEIPSGIKIGDLSDPLGQSSWLIGDLGATRASTFVLGQTTGQVFEHAGEDDAGTPISAFFETALSDLGVPERWKTVTEIEHFFTPTAAPQPVNVRVGTSVSGEDRALATEAGGYGVDGYGAGGYGSPNALDLSTGGPWITGHRITTRRLSLRIEAEAKTPITWLGASPTVIPRGPR